MSYYTTIKTVNRDGKPVKSEVICGGRSRGFTDAYSGEISFELSTCDAYSVYAKRSGECASSSVYGGKTVTLRLQ